jgi:hypothetical protein
MGLSACVPLLPPFSLIPTDVVAVLPEPSRLKQAAVSATDMAGAGLPLQLQGGAGIRALREGGYSAGSILQAKLGDGFSLRTAGGPFVVMVVVGGGAAGGSSKWEVERALCAA